MFNCPRCGTALELSLRAVEGGNAAAAVMPIKSGPRPRDEITFVLAGRSYTLSREDIRKAAAQGAPNTVQKYYVGLPDADGNQHDFPIKQIVRQALKARYLQDFIEKNFTAYRARDILRRLGFDVRET